MFWPLLFLESIWIGFIIFKKKYTVLLLPLIALLSHHYIDPKHSIIILSMFSFLFSIWKYNISEEVVCSILLYISGFQLIALSNWLVFAPFQINNPLLHISNLELDIYYLGSYLTPLLAIPIFFMWIIRPYLNWTMEWDLDISTKKQREHSAFTNFLFISSIILSVIFGAYPFLPNINPEPQRIGVDYHVYLDNAALVQNNPLESFNVMAGERPLIFIFIWSFQRFLNLDVATAVRYLPTVLNPILTLSVYFMTREYTNDLQIASWAAFFSTCGYNITVGIYAFFLANMLGLSCIFFSLGGLFRAIKNGKKKTAILAAMIGGLSVYAHPWTFEQIFVSSILFSILVVYKSRNKDPTIHNNYKIYIIYSVVLIFFELSKEVIFNGVGGIQATTTKIDYFIGFSSYWFDNIFSFRYLFGGFLSNNLTLLLAAVGLYVSPTKDKGGAFWDIYFIVSSILFLVGNNTIKSRIIFNAPLAMFAAIGLVYIINQEKNNTKKRLYQFSVILYSLTYVLRSLANLG